MVKIEKYISKEGIERQKINLMGIGDEEEVNLTLKFDKLYSRLVKKVDGTEFESFSILATYHKQPNEDYEVLVNITSTMKRSLDRITLSKGLKITAYKNGKWINFKLYGFKTPIIKTEEKKVVQTVSSGIKLNILKLSEEEENTVKAIIDYRKQNNNVKITLSDVKEHFLGRDDKTIQEIIDKKINL
jgi:hypothetical protein